MSGEPTRPTVSDMLPCPFCGGRAYVARTDRFPEAPPDNDPDRFAYSGRCVTCAAQGPWNKTSREAAIRDWNKRPGEEAAYTEAIGRIRNWEGR